MENLYSLSTLFGVLIVGVIVFMHRARLCSFFLKGKQDIDKLYKFKAAIESSQHGFVITDLNGNILYVNDAWERLNGYTRSEVYGKNIEILRSGKTSSKLYKTMQKTLKSGKSFCTEDFFNKRKDNTEYNARVEVTPTYKNGKQLHYLTITEDISVRKKTQEAQVEFLSLASHQLRTPLSVIDWYTETLLSSSVGKLNKKQHSYIQEIYNTNQHMLKLVDMLLNTSRLELGTFAVSPEPTDMKQIVKSILTELKPEIEGKSLNITEEFSHDLPTIRVDKNLARIVAQNVISNAVRYTSTDGDVWVVLKYISAGSLVKNKVIPVESILLSVQDTGIGIPKIESGQVFSKLFRAENAREHHTAGTGLGLYIVKSILNQTRGDIWFVSEEGVGTTFYVTIPVKGLHAGSHLSIISSS